MRTKNKQRYLILKMILAILFISAVTAVSIAIYKQEISGNISATASKVIAEIESQENVDGILNKNNKTVEYFFKVKNYTMENDEIKINPVEVEYFLNITGLEKEIITTKLYYIDKEGNETEVHQLLSGEFKGYYHHDGFLSNIEKEEYSYKLVVNLIDESEEEQNLNITIDLGYTQYIHDMETMKPNVPELVEGMIPVVWDGSNWVTVSKDSKDWYNYEEKHWANVALVAEENKAKYIDAIKGTIVEEHEINAMYVWIPRFVYKINPDYYHKKVTSLEMNEAPVEIHFSKTELEGGDFWDTSIEINSKQDADASNGKWTINPAFTFDHIELNGIWVAKFQASNVSNNAAGSSGPYNFKAGKMSISSISLDNIFTVCRNMEKQSRYGLPIVSGDLKEDGTFENDNNGYDTHLIKNSEWATVAFLSNSKYGQSNTEVKINPYFITGGNSDAPTVFNDNVLMSSTGNSTGVYDMSGARWEYVSAHIGDAVNNTQFPLVSNVLTRYKDIYHIEGTNYSSQLAIYNMFSKYKCTAIWETSETGVNSYDTWFEGRSNIGSNTNIVITRGTAADGKGTVTVPSSIYSFGYSDGTGADSRSFRSVLVVSDEL